MQIIAGPRGSGKTTELIRLCKKTPGSVIVCPNEQRVMALMYTATYLKIKIPKPVSIYKLMNDALHPSDGSYLIFDDVELCLNNILPIGFSPFAMAFDLTMNNVKILQAGVDNVQNTTI